MNSINETQAAITALKHLNCEIWVSYILKDKNNLLSGERLIDGLKLLNDNNINVVLLNCNPLKRTKNAVDNIVDNWHGKWGIYPNLGLGEPSPDGHIENYSSIYNFTQTIKYAINYGASLIGGCCGSSPNHIAKIKKIIKSY